jgi:protein-disulfide isomerase
MPAAAGSWMRLRRLASLVPITLLLMTLAPAALAQDDEPELVWAPLETPPPVVAPAVLTPTELADGFSLGAPDAPVVVEVWEDFQCPHCQRFSLEVKPALVEYYVQPGDARLVFRNLAFLGDESHWAAVAAGLAAEQNAFWPFHDYLFANFGGAESGAYHIDRLLEMGEASGLDMERFRDGLVLENARASFARMQQEAHADALAAGINATPTVVVNGQRVASPDLATVAAAIDEALAVAAEAGATLTEEPEDGAEDGGEG